MDNDIFYILLKCLKYAPNSISSVIFIWLSPLSSPNEKRADGKSQNTNLVTSRDHRYSLNNVLLHFIIL